MDRIQIDAIAPGLTVTEYSVSRDPFCLFVLYSGKAWLVQGEQERICRAPIAFWGEFAHPGRVRLQAGSRGILVRLSGAQLHSVLPGGQVAGFVQRAVSETTLVSLDKDEDRTAVTVMLDLLSISARERDPMSTEIVRHGVTQLLCRLLKSLAQLESERSLLPRRVVHAFCRLVDQNLTNHWTVARYAAEVGVTRDHLQSAVRRTLSQSPLTYIHARLMDRSIALLKTSDLTVAEISYRLGFTDAGYFNRFFKRQTGLAPGRFRRQARHSDDQANPPETFSAWP